MRTTNTAPPHSGETRKGCRAQSTPPAPQPRRPARKRHCRYSTLHADTRHFREEDRPRDRAAKIGVIRPGRREGERRDQRTRPSGAAALNHEGRRDHEKSACRHPSAAPQRQPERVVKPGGILRLEIVALNEKRDTLSFRCRFSRYYVTLTGKVERFFASHEQTKTFGENHCLHDQNIAQSARNDGDRRVQPVSPQGRAGTVLRRPGRSRRAALHRGRVLGIRRQRSLPMPIASLVSMAASQQKRAARFNGFYLFQGLDQLQAAGADFAKAASQGAQRQVPQPSGGLSNLFIQRDTPTLFARRLVCDASAMTASNS